MDRAMSSINCGDFSILLPTTMISAPALQFSKAFSGVQIPPPITRGISMD